MDLNLLVKSFSFSVTIFTASPVQARQDARELDAEGTDVENKISALLEGGVRRKIKKLLKAWYLPHSRIKEGVSWASWVEQFKESDLPGKAFSLPHRIVQGSPEGKCPEVLG